VKSGLGDDNIRARQTQAHKLLMDEAAVQKLDEWMSDLIPYDIVMLWNNSLDDSHEYLLACWFPAAKKMQFIRIFSIGGKAHLSVDWELYPSDFA